MSEYKMVNIAEQAEVLMGQSPSSSACSETGEGIPFIQGNAEFGDRHPTPRLKCLSPTRLAEAGDLLLSVRAPVGELNQATEKIVIGRGLAALRFQPQERQYAWHAVKCSAGALYRVAQGSTFGAVSRQDIERLKIPWHGSENKRIATVLDKVDEAIAKTKAVIAKLKQVRAGLLHDLLTRGLDEHGQLRDPIAHPEQFKDFPLGKIPIEWRIGNVSSIAINRDARRVPLKQADRDSRRGIYPYYGASGIIDFIDNYLFDGQFVLIGEDGENLRSREVPLAFIATGNFWVNNHAHILEPMPDTDVRFLATILEAKDYMPWLLGSAQPKLTQRNLEQISLRIPSHREQTIISDQLTMIDTQQEVEKMNLSKQKQLKSGLMADLLTGRVRVPESLTTELA